MNKEQFLKIWFNHGGMVVLFKVFNFFILNTLLQYYISLEEFPLYGALVYLPSVVLLLIVPKLMERTAAINALGRCLSLILIVLILFATLALTHNLLLRGLLIASAMMAFLSSLESVFFDKVTAIYCSYDDLPFAINVTRIANTLGYILGPLIGSIFFNTLSFANLFVVSMFFVVLYRFFLYSIPWELQENNQLQAQFHHTYHHKAPVSKYSILYLYGLNFIWLNLISIMIIPYYSLSFTVSEIGGILAVGGVGMLLGNIFSMSLLKRFDYERFYGLTIAGLLFSLCMVALFGSNYFLSCAFIFLGSFLSSICYALAQFFSLSIVDTTSLSTFYGVRNFINTLISVLLFFLLWLLVGSSFSEVLKRYFHFEQSGLMSLFFIFIGVASLVFYLVVVFYACQRKSSLLKSPSGQ